MVFLWLKLWRIRCCAGDILARNKKFKNFIVERIEIIGQNTVTGDLERPE